MQPFVLVVAFATLFLTNADDESVLKDVKQAGQSGVNWLENAATDVGKFLAMSGKTIGEEAQNAWNATEAKAGELAAGAHGAAKEVAAKTGEFADGAKKWVEGAVETVKRGGQDAVNATQEMMEKARKEMELGAQPGAESMQPNGVNPAAGEPTKDEKGVFDKIGDFFRSIGK
ncbi:unnamed protein product [Nippostrongylus brasiliensis]|uniref:Late embryogenesis abundant protein D-29-like n=1 Tax=Nippostrongylus brasiliensis TaxID=27835 RepID=A0A0N4Y0Z7_NIPBR|nr:unnamed protein product [Nippostrongylus brasiliensis]